MALIQLRRGTAAQWTAANPVLSSGEPGVETDTGKMKVGNGTQTWTALPYAAGSGGVSSVNLRTGAVTLDKTDVGLSNVDNTSDASKPISTATQTALNAKAPIANPTFTGTVGGINAAMVGLGSVDNTSDLSKPISTATQAALDLKENIADAFSGSAADLTGLFNAVVDTITSTTARVGLCVMVGYNDAGSAWPTVPSNLISDSNVSLHWVGGDAAHPPPTSAGPALWDRPVA